MQYQETKNLTPRILSNKIFKEDTYTVKHTTSSLKLNAIDKRHIDTNWKNFLKEAKLKGDKPWDGNYYRMENIENITSGLKELTLSTIKYSLVRGLIENPNIQANNIGTASLIQTNDGYFIFGVRNSNSTSKSRIDLIGGGLQESEFIVNNFSDIFENQFKEIKEETGLIEKDIKDIHGIGIVQSGYSNVLFVFLTLLNKSKSEVQEIFSKHRDDEMVKLEFIQEDLLKEYLKDKGDYRPLIAELYFSSSI